MDRAEIYAKIAAIEANPKSLNKPGRLMKYNPRATAKLDDLRRELVSLIRAEKIARGEYVNDAGYSGRNSNRR